VTEKMEVRVPDIGDFKDVPVVEVLVKQGDDVAVEQALATIETDKATMEVPSPLAGRVESVALKVGDKVSHGTLIATISTSSSKPSAPPSNPQIVGTCRTEGEAVYDLAVIGGGPGGYSAAFRAADLGMKVVVIERHKVLGGVCLNVGCIPSKALLHVAGIKEEAERIASLGVKFGEAAIDLGALRDFKVATVKRLTDGLSQMAKARNVEIVQGTAKFGSSDHLTVELASGGDRTIRFRQCIIAAGSSAVHLPFLPKDPRIVDSTGALQLPFVPKKLLVIGGGIIGLEMATVYGALGARVDVVERLPELLSGVDPDAVAIWRKQNAHRFDQVMLGASVERGELAGDGIAVTIKRDTFVTNTYDLVLQAAGRSPNGRSLGLAAAGLDCDARGFISVDKQMRTAVPNIFAIGDIVEGPMLAHKAVHEAHVAAEVAAGLKSFFDAGVIPSVAYTDPEIAWVGLSEKAAVASGRAVKSAKFPWTASGRAIAAGAAYGMTKLVFDAETHRVVGGTIVGPRAGDMIGEICLAIELGADAVDIGKTIHPHPTLGETIGMAAELFEGVCTDLPPVGRAPARKSALVQRLLVP